MDPFCMLVVQWLPSSFSIVEKVAVEGFNKSRSVTFYVPSITTFLYLGDLRPRKTSELEPKTSHYERF